jgi:curved DNA-binding protein CbpA
MVNPGELARWRSTDFYQILNVPKNATVEELKRAYKREAMKWHPDRHAQKSDKEREEAEERFKLVSEANSIFQDPVKKRIYDRDGLEGLKREATRERTADGKGKSEGKRGGHMCDPFENYMSDTKTQDAFYKVRNQDVFACYSTDMDSQRAYYKAKNKSAWGAANLPAGKSQANGAPAPTQRPASAGQGPYSPPPNAEQQKLKSPKSWNPFASSLKKEGASSNKASLPSSSPHDRAHESPFNYSTDPNPTPSAFSCRDDTLPQSHGQGALRHPHPSTSRVASGEAENQGKRDDKVPKPTIFSVRSVLRPAHHKAASACVGVYFVTDDLVMIR